MHQRLCIEKDSHWIILFLTCRVCFSDNNNKYYYQTIINLLSFVTSQRRTRSNHDRNVARISGKTIHLNDAVLILAHLCDMYTACAVYIIRSRSSARHAECDHYVCMFRDRAHIRYP